MAEETKQTKARCLKCGETVTHNRRQIQGCNCDPDAPTWVYIELDGTIRGFSQAEWERVDT
jgi:hypothetical protein